MRGCILSLGLFTLMVIGFIVGALSNQAGLLMVSVFLSPLVWFIAGWSAKGLFSGRRLTFVAVEREQGEATVSNRRAPEPL